MNYPYILVSFKSLREFLIIAVARIVRTLSQSPPSLGEKKFKAPKLGVGG
jgi:hypothetical protein